MSLYKYVMAERWESILVGGLIRFTQPSVFNDPFEMQPHFEFLDEETELRKGFLSLLSDEARTQRMWDAVLQMMYMDIPDAARGQITFEVFKTITEQALKRDEGEILETIEYVISMLSGKHGRLPPELTDKFLFINKLVGVLALTEKNDNLLMWAHYADNHRGLVIEFDDEHEYFHQLLESSPPLRFLLSPLSTFKLTNEQWDYLEKRAAEFKFKVDGAQSPASEESNTRCLLKVVYSEERPNRASFKELTESDLLLVKSKDWEYEQEWRMLRLLCDADKVIPNEDGDIHLFPFPPNCITGIIFGCRMPIYIKENMLKYIAGEKRYSHTKVYQAVLNERHFKLDILPIKT